MNFSLTNKTGYTARNEVRIFKGGYPFYFFKKKGLIRFNLPKGEGYYSELPIEKQRKPFEVKTKTLRKRENFDYKAPSVGLRVLYTENPNKASIRPYEGIITIDKSFLDKEKYPEYVPLYLKYHEVGHYHYNTESFCDEFARDMMLAEGYNLSQIENAAKLTLHYGHERHVKCLEGIATAKIK